jgi:hypothetical protein
MTDVRRVFRWVVNIVSLVLAILALPEFVALLPEETLIVIATVVPVVNGILSWLRPLVGTEQTSQTIQKTW